MVEVQNYKLSILISNFILVCDWFIHDTKTHDMPFLIITHIEKLHEVTCATDNFLMRGIKKLHTTVRINLSVCLLVVDVKLILQ